MLDRGSEEVYDTFHVDDLAKDYFIDRLSEVDGIDDELARLWITEDGEGYRNLRTASSALTSDTAHREQVRRRRPTNCSTSSEKRASTGTSIAQTPESYASRSGSRRNLTTRKKLKGR